MSKLRNCCFTINNWEPKIEDLSGWIIKLKICTTYGVFGKEVGDSGTPHLQGFLEFRNPISFKIVQKLLFAGHIERRKGTSRQASDYCMKEEDFEEWGEISNQGKRTDLIEIREAVEDGESLRNIIVNDIAKNFQGIRMSEKILTLFEKPRTKKPIVKWFYGASGTGKSFTAFKEARAIEEPYVANDNSIWWDGYDAGHCVIIDDIRQDWKKFSDLIKLLDENPYKVEVKGGYRMFKAEHIWITCPRHPCVLFDDIDEDLEQLTSRIDEIRWFGGENRRLQTGTEVTGTEVRKGNTNLSCDGDF